VTTGVGGSDAEAELARLASLPAMRDGVAPIAVEELGRRIAKVQGILRARDIGALYLDASTSAFYFTGVRFSPSERMHGVVIPAEGEIIFISPAFEEAKLKTMMAFPAEARCWEEYESPAALAIDVIRGRGVQSGRIALDPATPFFTFDALRAVAGDRFQFVNGSVAINPCRMIKSQQEVALIRRAMAITLEVQKAAARILREGISTLEVASFINKAHVALGADGPAEFNIVLFGEPTAYPHGVPYPQALKKGDMVLMDCGARLHGYLSDLTRSYVYGDATVRQREIWSLARRAADAAFDAAQIGVPCEEVDAAARRVIESAGLGPRYATPGLPHRTGHGLGLDVHEEPYIVEGGKTPLAAGMCFSNEPMICVYGEFGVRLEDHICMTAEGPTWFTKPSASVDEPFGAVA